MIINEKYLLCMREIEDVEDKNNNINNTKYNTSRKN